MTEEKSFAEWLNKQLHKHNITQKDLADRAEVGKSTINKLVNQIVVRPDANTYVAIAKALGESPITVLRIAGILPPDPDLPELEDYKVVLAGMSHEARITGLELLRTLAEREKRIKKGDYYL